MPMTIPIDAANLRDVFIACAIATGVVG